MQRLVLAAFAFALSIAAAHAAPDYSYDASKPVAATIGDARTVEPGVAARTFTFTSPTGNTVTGEIVTGTTVTGPGVLFVHWLGEKNNDHTEFMPDAVALAKRGTTSVLIDAMWSKRGWFGSVGKDAEADARMTVNQVIDMRRALDLLLAQPGVDPNRIAFVGHDFGAMMGSLMAAVDSRPRYWVMLAPTTTLSEWYLWEKQHPNRDAYVARLAEFDLLGALKRSHAQGYLFQFSAHDHYIPADKAAAYFAAAPLPKGAFYYDAPHDLMVPDAFRDRQAWLIERLFGK